MDAPGDEALPAHHVLLGAGIPIVENLIGVEQVATLCDPVIVVLPLALREADGAPARVVAFERETLGG